MKRCFYLLCLLFAALVHEGAGQTSSIPYDCRNYADACSGNGDCDLSTGQCSCTTGTQYNCANAVASSTAACTADTCDPTNTYLCLAGSPNDCICNDLWTTDSNIADTLGCAVPRVYATCTDAAFNINIYPYLGTHFAGRIRYMIQDGSALTDTCADIAEDASTGIWKVTAYPYTASTGDDCPIPLSTSGAPPYILYLYIQYNPKLTSSTDLKIKVECTEPTSEETLARVTVQNADPSPTESDTNSFAADVDSGAAVGLYMAGSETALSGEIAHGTLIELRVTVDITGIITNYAFVSAESSNYDFDDFTDGSTPPNALSEFMVQQGCVPESSTNIVVSLTKAKVVDDGVFKLVFRGFRWTKQADGYADSDSVAVGTSYIQIKLVLGTWDRTEATCGDISGMSTNDAFEDVIAPFARRRKRSVEEEDEEEENRDVFLNVSMVVSSPFSQPHDSQGRLPNADESSCYDSAAFIVPLALMALLMLVSIGFAFYFCSRLTGRHGNPMDGTTNMAFKS